MKNIVNAVITAFFLAFIFTAEAFGCSCVPEDISLTPGKRVKRAVESAGAVFSAKVVAVKIDDSENQQITFTVEVVKVWKGRTPRFTTVSTGSNSAMCGYAFSVGETYLIYAGGKSADGFHTTHCTRTARLNVTSDVRYLGKGRKPRRE
jgi:hypothetical protein